MIYNKVNVYYGNIKIRQDSNNKELVGILRDIQKGM
jgi:hypothetical protein